MIERREDDNRMALTQNDCVKTEMNAAAPKALPGLENLPWKVPTASQRGSAGQLGDVRDPVHHAVELCQQREPVVAQHRLVGHHHDLVEERIDDTAHAS